MKKLERLQKELINYDYEPPKIVKKEDKGKSLFGQMTSWLSNNQQEEEKETVVNKPKGVYIYGDVGSGKTMVMDLFLESLPFEHMQRTHFNSFMANVHSSLFIISFCLY